MDIQQTIQQKLTEIEQKENVTILHAVESGSRAWGFASPDSDYDVRFIYVRRKDDYLRLEKTSDVIEWQLDETLDINGWDLQKALILLHKSNPTLFEWNSSPIVYRTTDYWERIQGVINGFFMDKAGLYHYLSMAKGNFREYLKGETVRLKKYFYVLRPVLAARWITKRHCPPPMLFTELADAMLDPSMRTEIDRLLELKMQTPEIGNGAQIPALNAYLERTIAELENYVAQLSQERENDWQQLDRIFLEGIAFGASQQPHSGGNP